MNRLFECDGVTVVRSRRRLLADVDLALVPGELLAVMGENGAGKSTLLRAMAGEIVPDVGEVRLAGRRLAAWKPREIARRRAVLPQDSSVAFPFTAFEVALLGRAPHDGGRPGARDRAIAHDALAATDAAHLEHRLYPTLSGGERARVMLARVLAQLAEPADTGRALLLDEPVAALDIAHQHLALRIAGEAAHREGMGVIAVLHDLNLAARYADRVFLMKAGRLVAAGPPDAVLTEARMSECFSMNLLTVRHPACSHALVVAAH